VSALRASLRRASKAAKRSLESAKDRPLRHIQWTPPQDQIHRLQAQRKLLRSGNQFGKTTAALAEVIWRCTGTHPHYPTRPPPIEAWVVCTSWQQAVAIMCKFHDLCPIEAIDRRRSSNFTLRNGYGKDNPTVVFVCGSVLRFRTTNQGPTALQGATVDYVLIDEPTDLGIYRELDRRLLRTGGSLCLSLTPVNRDCTWLREMVEQGVIQEVHAKLTAPNLIPVGAAGPLCLPDGTPMDQAWIDAERLRTPAIYAPVVLDGEWDMRPEGVYFECFDRSRHVSQTAVLNPTRGNVRWVLGIDYSAADRAFGQVGALAQVQSQVDEKKRRREAVIVHDLVMMDGVVTNRQFAAAVLEMLARNGIAWRDLHSVHGDNPVESRWALKSNIETMRALALEMGVSYGSLQPRIRAAKEGSASLAMLTAGCRYLWELIAEDRFTIRPRAMSMAEALETWDYTKHHPSKDRVDALRYALKPWIQPRGRGSGFVLRAG
jgi:phage terminase large subunit-like protein